jgi:hypothetical protein
MSPLAPASAPETETLPRPPTDYELKSRSKFLCAIGMR